MKPKKILFWAAVVVTIAAVIISLASLDDPKLNPVSSRCGGIRAISRLRAELVSGPATRGLT
jgi:hypothetical protein